MTIENGTVGRDDAFAEHGVTAGYRVTVPGIDHTVASVFWDFMNLTGTVHEDGAYVEQDLFENPFYAVGYPITEAYWSEVEVAGTARDVLWQCFERRCLTYTPGNPEGFLVEAGNVGQHYYRWRHGDAQPETETVNIYLVEPGDATEPNGDATDGTFGCGDMIAPIEVQIDAQEDVAGRITASLTALLAYEQPELYNVFQNSDLTVADVQVHSDVAVVNLSGTLRLGGVCDEPRVQEQIEQTVLQFEEISRVVLLLNGGPVSDNPQLSELQGGVLATFDVSGEHFNLWTTNEETITDILALQADPTLATFPNGPILRGPGEADHNGPWSWHLDPAATEMAEMTIEVCDGRPSYVEANVDEFVDTVGRYCPWSAELVEVQDLREPAP